MLVQAIRTPIVAIHDNVLELIKNAVPKLPERSVLVVTSKIVSLSQGLVVPLGDHSRTFKQDLIRQESDFYTEPTESPYDVMLTIKHGLLAVSAGIDESNVQDHYVLLPEDPYADARRIWEYLRQEYGVREVGVVITDSTTLPLKWGVVGRALAHCGFEAVKNRIGDPDLFGRALTITKMNIAEGIAAAAVLEMGEGNESTPLCLVSDVKHIKFLDLPPTPEEIAEQHIPLADDVYAPAIGVAPWKKGGISKVK